MKLCFQFVRQAKGPRCTPFAAEKFAANCAYNADPLSAPCAPAYGAPTIATFHMRMGFKPICNHSDMQNYWCKDNYSLPIYFAFYLHDTYFWCAVTLVCVRMDAVGVDWG